MNGDRKEITVNGFDFLVTTEYDNDADPPWHQGDGNGDVRTCNTPYWQGEWQSTKRPGERPMNKPTNRQYQYYYDWAGACKKAREEGWNTPPYDAPNRVQRAVQADFEYLAGWVNDEWQYVVVSVVLVNRPEYESTICGVETYKYYHEERVIEMAEEVIEEYLDDMEKGKLRGMPVEEALEGAENNKLKGVKDEMHDM